MEDKEEADRIEEEIGKLSNERNDIDKKLSVLAGRRTSINISEALITGRYVKTVCENCGGTGECFDDDEEKRVSCSACDGYGYIYRQLWKKKEIAESGWTDRQIKETVGIKCK